MPAVTALPPLAKRRPDMPVEVLAARTLSLATLGPRRRAERRAESVAALEALAGASLLELRQKLPTRYWVLAMLALMGKSVREMATAVGYAGPTPVLKALRHPAVVRLVEQVRAEQLERVLSGTYGTDAAHSASRPISRPKRRPRRPSCRSGAAPDPRQGGAWKNTRTKHGQSADSVRGRRLVSAAACDAETLGRHDELRKCRGGESNP